MEKYKSFAFTIRPKNGLKENLQIRIEKYLKKYLYYSMCIEKEDEARHCHCQVWVDEPIYKGNLTKALRKIQSSMDPDWDVASSKVLTSGVKIAYSNSFYEEYMRKENNLILDNPPSIPEDYYPSEEEQQKVKDKVNAVDSRFHKLKCLFEESGRVFSKEEIKYFLADVMYYSKKIPVINKRIDRISLVDNLYAYCCNDIEECVKMFEKMDNG